MALPNDVVSARLGRRRYLLLRIDSREVLRRPGYNVGCVVNESPNPTGVTIIYSAKSSEFLIRIALFAQPDFQPKLEHGLSLPSRLKIAKLTQDTNPQRA